MDASATLTLDQLRAAGAAGGIASVTLRAEGADFYVRVVTANGGERVLVKTRSREPRGFADPRRALLLLREAGVDTARVEAGAWTPEAATRASRPDRAQALKRTHAMAEHDAWFRREVGQALEELASGEVELIPHEVVKAEWAERRAALLARADKEGR
ncbi:MAG: hypothetical protein JWP35_454 [Caulobacter sp.]|nr:hypothetical protein [Caulobacter sp.]